ncbi:Uncharacterized conserved protein, DUF433 family [Bradyrhizobium sp. Rc3b]|uniref:DUF433 domain-containing protein n=1 Tax=Bradyrhizobium sp. Rc3b TaxID=1855322 RepID=UPI0008ECF92B|nr:DUF433 domain-containing protein [Bradyrhizobium sp. Rc3b]SFN44181.1 Uncharacterized conserved protein, DUF433 family [Bradyrhizobium sp. Rc3b]
MRLLDAQVCDGELLLVLHGDRAEMFTARAMLADILGTRVHLVTAGMLRRIRGGQRNVGESTLDFLARIALVEAVAGSLSADELVIVRHPDVLSGSPVFRGTRVPPGPVFATLADRLAGEIVCLGYPQLSPDEIKMALQQACRLLERDAPLMSRS